ncbi:MAG: alpha/beta hydrolase, partial [Myxococcales bacterium]
MNATLSSLPLPQRLTETLDGLLPSFLRPTPLSEPFEAKRSHISSTHGDLALYSDKSAKGRPLLLIHSVNAAASSYEVKPIFEHYARHRPVHALDLPGFGNSGRDSGRYDAARFAGAITDALRLISKEDQPADIVALSLGCEFAARAALEVPDMVRSLVFVSPTGLARESSEPVIGQLSRHQKAEKVHRVLSTPVVSDAIYGALTLKPVMKHYLNKSFVGPVDRGLLDYNHLSAHQPGAKHAPLWFLSGALFTPDAYTSLYARLRNPTLVLLDQDAYTSFDRLPELQRDHANWEAARIHNSRGLPHFERQDETFAQVDSFFSKQSAEPVALARLTSPSSVWRFPMVPLPRLLLLATMLAAPLAVGCKSRGAPGHSDGEAGRGSLAPGVVHE